MKFRLIHFKHFSAFMNMGLDEAIMENIRSVQAMPTIRLYGWTPSAVSIGYFQCLVNEVNLEACRRAGVDVVRRITGGGAVYHDTEGEVTYSIIGPLSIFPANIIDSYRMVCDDIIYALQLLGIQASFQPINDLIVDGKKISGNAQTRKAGMLLQHGTILYRVDVEKMFSLLTVSDVKISDKLITSVKKRVTCVSEYSAASLQDLTEALETGFSRNREVDVQDYSPQELERGKQLANEKYSTIEWVGMR
jgi:lipoate-protein ligase A